MPSITICRETIATPARLRERDINLTFATGRHVLVFARLFCDAFAPDVVFITGNGREFTRWKADALHRQDPILRLPIRRDAASCSDTRASMHVFNDNGWFTGREIPALPVRLQRLSLSGYQYKSIPAHQVTKICFAAIKHDLIRLRISAQCEAMEERATLCSLPSTASKCYRWVQ